MNKRNKFDNLKEEVSEELGVDIKENVDMGDLPSNFVGKITNCGKVGGEMVKKIIREQEEKMK